MLVITIGEATGPGALAVYHVTRRTGGLWLPVNPADDEVVIGPLTRGAETGCPWCVAARRRENLGSPEASGGPADVRVRRGGHRAAASAGYVGILPLRLPPLLLPAVAGLVADVAARERTGAILRVSARDGGVREHLFLPVPDCPRCGRLPLDGPQAGRRTRVVTDRNDPYTGRARDLRNLESEMTRRCVDAETGVVASVGTAAYGGFPNAVARRSPADGGPDSRHGYGRAVDYRNARATALAEALERGCSAAPRGRLSHVVASYAELGAAAVDPAMLGLHPPESYALAGFPFLPYDPGRRTAWVWGHSLRRGGPVLVPESIAYHGPRPSRDPGWVLETSNGCALGTTLDEAAFHGLLEVAERDAFLTTWYSRLAHPPIALESARDPLTQAVRTMLNHRFGYQLSAFAALTEHRVPAVIVLAMAEDPARRPVLVCGAGAATTMERALRAAVTELAPRIEGLRGRYDDVAAGAMARDPWLVEQLDDHALATGHPDAVPRYQFLTRQSDAVSMGDVAQRADLPAGSDPASDLDRLAARFLNEGTDVIVVDITSAEAAACGFRCAKVIAPGTAPLTFGHRYRRTSGLPRLLELPRLLGYRDHDLRPDELNGVPHAFS